MLMLMPMLAKYPSPSRRGLLLTLDAIVVFLFLLSIMQPFLLQTALMRAHAHERSMNDARVSLLMQLSQQLYTRGAAVRLQSGAILLPQNYTQVGYYDSDWNRNPNVVLSNLAELNLSSAVLDSSPSNSPQTSSQSRICLSRLMATDLGAVHTLWLCDS